MISSDTLVIAAAILVAGWVVAKAIEVAGKHIADRIDNSSRLVDRVGTKLDNLSSPLLGISDVMWRKSGFSTSLADDDD